ncbi:MAG TPA: AAA family ATPase [Dehalococcoidia bacterium]|nr:AAA family ATPase [Dehalococcoidia bacterium]
MPAVGEIFVGRQREMAALTAALEDALSGQGRLVMLAGEPGIGKTRMAQELAATAAGLGAQVLWGRCYEEAGAPPFWPWLQPLRAYVHQQDAGQLRSEMGPGAAEIAEIVSDVKERLPDLKPPPQLEPEQARFRLFDSIASFLKKVAQSQPLVLVLDDLHWADKPSLLLLQFVARDLADARVLLLGTYRDVEVSRQHPLSATLAQLSREPVFQRLMLRGLGREYTEPFIQAATGIRPSPRLVESIYQHTDGNPFFMGEVVRLLSDQGGLKGGEPGGPIGFQVPEGVRDAIGQRLNRLTEPCNKMLTAASVIGREFGLVLLGLLSPDQSEEQLLEALEEALGAKVIEELPGAAGQYQFSHALVQETLLEELSLTRRVRLHARIAEELERLYGAAAEAHAAELAHHFAEAESVLGAEKLVKYSLLAGEKALGSYAWEEADAHFRRGLAAKGISLEGTEPAQDGEVAALLFGLGQALAAIVGRLRVQEAVDLLGRAFDHYESAGDSARALAVAEYPLPPSPVGRTGIARFIPRALKLVPPDSLQAGRLLASYGTELGRVENDYESAQSAFGQALGIARRVQDVALEVRVLAAAADVDSYHLHLNEALQQARKAIELAPRIEGQQATWSANLTAARALWYMGQSRDAQPYALEGLALAEKLRDRYRLNFTFWVIARLYRHWGDWQQARDFCERGLEVAPQDNLLLAAQVLLEYELGDFDRGAAWLERLFETIPREVANRPSSQYAMPAHVISWVARITGELKQLDLAAAVAQTVLSSPYSAPMFVYSCRTSLGLLAVLRGDVAAAAQHYRFLEPWRGMLLIDISTDHVMGLLSHTMGNLDKAAEHFEEALAFCRKAGYRPELAWSLCDYADLLMTRNQAGDRPKAMSLLDESLAISSELGMKPLMQRVIVRQQGLESAPPAVPALPDGLTQRELEVLRLIAQGRSNRQIADELVISLNTVCHHVSNILSKTGTTNRAGVATYAAQHALLS